MPFDQDAALQHAHLSPAAPAGRWSCWISFSETCFNEHHNGLNRFNDAVEGDGLYGSRDRCCALIRPRKRAPHRETLRGQAASMRPPHPEGPGRLHSWFLAWIVGKNLVKIASPIQHTYNFGDIILHS